MGEPERIDVFVARRRQVAQQIVEFHLQRPDAGALPGFSPGAHLEVETPSGLGRNYSLTSVPEKAPIRYEIAVALDPHGEGGSFSMHAHAAEGTLLRISPPQGEYRIDTEAQELLLIAGGVGITPMLSIYRHLIASHGPPARLVYLTRSRAHAAYVEELDGIDVLLHAKEEYAGRRFDLWSVLAEPGDRRIFCCGPQPLLQEVRALTMHWRAKHLHFEDFSGVSALDPHAQPFTAVWLPTGARIDVPADRSLLDTLKDQGVAVSSSCRSGTCGTCRLRVLSGKVQHRDLALSDLERQDVMLCCVSRAEGEIELAPLYGY
ncbi:PDR/VanB family oxidoreductase [Nesterenkonia muleiensis]|uniref:PDR/VanB family oxidoreductase n=1 Tax=Nesterenkonia muleiensis TaxID=2282648 RepID=UPI000E720AEB|nr:PDR/VanB family oxidoreductase [Nesterenkonia muleiensis]